MTETPVAAITEHFSEVEDPRIDRTKKHKLIDIIVIAICAVICGADNWVAVETFGNARVDWFRQYLELPNGVPSHDTFGRVFAQLDPDQFQQSFLSWVQAVYEVTVGQVIPIDGKTIRRSYDTHLGKAAIHMVNVWASENNLMLAQTDVDEDGNEITAIPELLEMLALSGCIVTIDAMGCQQDIAQQIVEEGGDYILTVKKNQSKLHEAIISLFDHAQAQDFCDIDSDYHRTVDSGHGRIEIRECWTITASDYLNYAQQWNAWPQLSAIVMVRAERHVGDEVTVETRHFITNLAEDARTVLDAIRAHWSIESSAHWILDVVFREDDSRVRQGNAPQNLAVLRHMALNLLKNETTAEVGIQNKRLKAAWDQDYLLKVLDP